MSILAENFSSDSVKYQNQVDFKFKEIFKVCNSETNDDKIDLVYRCTEEQLRIFFIRTTKEDEELGADIHVGGCTLNFDPEMKLRILTIPAILLAPHLNDSMETIDFKPPLQIKYCYSKDVDALVIYFVSENLLLMGNLDLKILRTENFQESVMIDFSSKGVVSCEILNVKHLLPTVQ